MMGKWKGDWNRSVKKMYKQQLKYTSKPNYVTREPYTKKGLNEEEKVNHERKYRKSYWTIKIWNNGNVRQQGQDRRLSWTYHNQRILEERKKNNPKYK